MVEKSDQLMTKEPNEKSSVATNDARPYQTLVSKTKNINGTFGRTIKNKCWQTNKYGFYICKMKVDLRLPKGFTEHQTQETIYYNLEDETKEGVRKAIYNKPYCARYAAWDFNGLVWWDDNMAIGALRFGNIIIMKPLILQRPLEELIDEVKGIHGGK